MRTRIPPITLDGVAAGCLRRCCKTAILRLGEITVAALLSLSLVSGGVLCASGAAWAGAKSAKSQPVAVDPEGGEGGAEGEVVAPGPGGASMDAGAGAEEPQSRPIPPKTGDPAPVTFTAYLSEGSPAMTADVVWRIYEGHPRADSSYKLVKLLKEARPTVELRPGEYLVNAAYGRASVTKKIGVWPEKPVNEDFVVNAGGLRLSATLAKGPIASEHLLKFEVFAESQDQFGNRTRIPGDLRPGMVLRLNSGLYHIVSTYGDGNSVIAADAVIEPGKITEAVIDHDAGKVTLKLVQRAGGEAVADTRWTIYNASGEVIKESAGAFPTHILAAGDYRVAAQHGDRQYGGTFTVGAGESKLVEVIIQ